jgi:transposase InsO family protein
MATLPNARLGAYQRPFTFTGVDYFGPLEVTIGRRHEKRWGALFTCLVTRAVHIEVAASLSADSFILALRRFMGRRANPKEIHSDNGTNFVGANRELKEELQRMNQDQVTNELTNRGVKWTFIPPGAPHMGGSWERMVKAVKTALHAILKQRSPKEETLHTFLVEAENIVNGHPLTYVSSDQESDEMLTPNHFLIGTPNNLQPPGIFTDRDLIVTKQWRFAQRLADHFWKRWLTEFLPTLTRRQKWHERADPIKVGDIVVIADGDHPRNHWPKGRITEVQENKDGLPRWAIVKTQTGVYKRPVVKLCVLDVHPEVKPGKVN